MVWRDSKVHNTFFLLIITSSGLLVKIRLVIYLHLKIPENSMRLIL